MADVDVTAAELAGAQQVTDAVISQAQEQMTAFCNGLVRNADEGHLIASDAAGFIRAYAEDLGVKNNKVVAEIGNQLTELIRARALGESTYTAKITAAVDYQGAHGVYNAMDTLFSPLAEEKTLAERLAASREPINDALGAEMRRAQKENMLENIGMDYADMVDSGLLDNAGKIGYAVVPRGVTCTWCTIMASRGFVYWSRQSAGTAQQRNANFHANCDCAIVPGYHGEVSLGDYDADAYYRIYSAARKAAVAEHPGETPTIAQIQAQMRKQNPGMK